MRYLKPPLSIQSQIKLLQKRGLIIRDTKRAGHYLQHISYYRLRAYTYPFQDNRNPNHPFVQSVHFDEILELYIFDRELRIFLMDAIERIEVALRTQIIYEFSLAYGSHWYDDPTYYINPNRFAQDCKKLEKEIKRSTETFIRHYRKKYSQPKMPPAWMALEVSSLGLLSKFYENLKSTPPKKQIARHFGLGKPIVLESWLHCISYIRNIVAHHGRLWNRVITKQPMLPRIVQNTWLRNRKIPQNKLYLSLSCILDLLKTINPGTSFSKRLQALLKKHPIVNVQDMGFPKNWEQEALWK